MPGLATNATGLENKNAQVSSVYFGMKNFKQYEMCVNITALTNKGQSICNIQENDKASWAGYEKKLDAVKADIAKQVEKYLALEDSNLDVANAYVVFRSMEGPARLLKGLDKSKCTRGCLRCFSCCSSKYKDNIHHKYFQNTWFKARKAVDPTMIIWQNLGYSECNRCVRTLIITLISGALVLGTLIAIYQSKE
jgi:hypothetical protein